MQHEPELDFDPDETPDDKQLSHDIDDALSRARPERYDASDKDWMDPVVEMARGMLGKRQLDLMLIDVARRRVYRREAEATKRTNRILRDIDSSGQLPIGWGEGEGAEWRDMLFDILHLPLSIDGKRIRLGVAIASDLEQWESQSVRERERWVDARVGAERGAHLLARWLKEQGVKRVEDLRPKRATDEST